jgi:S-formylglutathione hydrolase FrmB
VARPLGLGQDGRIDKNIPTLAGRPTGASYYDGPRHRAGYSRRGAGLQGLADLAAGWPGALLLLASVGAVGGLALAGELDPVAVDRGPALWVVVALASVGAAVSLGTRPAHWWRRTAPRIALAVSIVIALAWVWLATSGLTGDSPYPDRFVVYAWVALFVLGAGLSGLRHGSHTLRTTRALSGPAAVLAVFLVINSFYGYWPTVGALLGHPLPGQVNRRSLAAELHERRPPPRNGAFGPVSIPGTSVGFHAATAYLWLPPAWDRVPHADFPVIVTLTGIPGRAQDWAVAGGAIDASSAWAATHHGVAPPVLMVNENGSPVHDTECLDSREGNAFSYLTEVVPRFITKVLGIPHAPERWGLVGFSEGGTCSLLLAVKDHDLFGRFVDIAGDAAPDFGPGGRLTLQVLFDGNRAEQDAWNPRLLMAHHRYPYLEGWFSTGLQDRGHRVLEPELAADASRAGMTVHHYWAAGHHTWIFARQAFEHLYPSFVHALLSGKRSTSVTGAMGPPEPTSGLGLATLGPRPAGAGASRALRRRS